MQVTCHIVHRIETVLESARLPAPRAPVSHRAKGSGGVVLPIDLLDVAWGHRLLSTGGRCV